MKIRKNSGFSLIELIIVIAILGIVAGIAAPNFTRYRDNTNLREAARDVMSDIQLYKQRAMAENINYLITFTGNTYKVERGPSFDDVTTKTVGTGSATIVILSSSYSGGIEFLPRGTMTNGTLVLKHARRLSEARITTTTMGRVRVTYVLK